MKLLASQPRSQTELLDPAGTERKGVLVAAQDGTFRKDPQYVAADDGLLLF